MASEYRYAGKEKKLSLGRYPDVVLKEARERAADARKPIASGTDPWEKTRSDQLAATLAAANTFTAVANEYIVKSEREGRAPVTVGGIKASADGYDLAASDSRQEALYGRLLEGLGRADTQLIAAHVAQSSGPGAARPSDPPVAGGDRSVSGEPVDEEGSAAPG